MLERQSEYAVRVMKRMTREKVTAVEVKPGWADRYHRWLMSKMEGTSWQMCTNYFTVENGKIVTQWPYGPTMYSWMTKLMGRPSETTHRRDGVPSVPAGTTGG